MNGFGEIHSKNSFTSWLWGDNWPWLIIDKDINCNHYQILQVSPQITIFLFLIAALSLSVTRWENYLFFSEFLNYLRFHILKWSWRSGYVGVRNDGQRRGDAFQFCKHCFGCFGRRYECFIGLMVGPEALRKPPWSGNRKRRHDRGGVIAAFLQNLGQRVNVVVDWSCIPINARPLRIQAREERQVRRQRERDRAICFHKLYGFCRECIDVRRRSLRTMAWECILPECINTDYDDITLRLWGFSR